MNKEIKESNDNEIRRTFVRITFRNKIKEDRKHRIKINGNINEERLFV